MSDNKDEFKIGINNNSVTFKIFTFNQFDASHPSIVMIAKRKSGKSVIVRNILAYLHDIPVGTIISTTDLQNHDYNFYPNSYIHYKYNPDILEKIFARQQSILDIRKEYAIKYKKKVDSRCFIVMDDCLADKKTWSKDGYIYELLFNGRHSHIMYILTMQYPLGIAPDLRSNFDFVFLMATDIVSNIKKLHDHWAGVFENYKEFRFVFNNLTQNYGSMVLTASSANSSLFDKVYYYKAPDPKTHPITCSFGAHQMKKYHEKNFDKNWEKRGKIDYQTIRKNREKKIDLNEWFKNKIKNHQPIVVKKEGDVDD